MASEWIRIANLKAVDRHFKALDIRNNKQAQSDARKVLRKPMMKINKEARVNLKSLMSSSPVSTGALYRGLGVGSRFTKRTGYVSAAFGARTNKTTANKPPRKGKFNSSKKTRAAVNHFHLVNSGTKRRYHRNFKGVGAVGKRKTTKHRRINPAFRLSGEHSGFADRAIKANIGYIQANLGKDLASLYAQIKTPGT